MIRALIVSEVAPGRTEGSRRMITEIAEQLTATGEAVLHTVGTDRGARWAEAWRGGGAVLPHPDVLHFYPVGSLTRPALVRAALWRRAFPRAGFLFHGFQMPNKPLPPAFAIRGTLRKRALVLTPSAELAGRIRTLVSTQLVPPTVDSRAFRLPRQEERIAARRDFGIDDADFVVLHAGHVRINRNLDVLCALVARGFRAILIVSPHFSPDTALLTRLEASGVRIVTGEQDLPRWYWAADRYVFPVVQASGAVGLPLSVLEALACGLPTVCTRFDGLYAHLGEGWPGITWADAAEIPAVLDGVRADGLAVDGGKLSQAVSSRFGFAPVLEIYREAYRRVALP